MSECKKECEKKRFDEMALIPLAASELHAERLERTNKRLTAIVILLIVFLLGTNIAWLWYESQFEVIETHESIVVDSDAGGNANYIGQDGDIYNGENHSDEDYQKESQEE